MQEEQLGKLREDIVFEARMRGHSLRFHSTWGLFNPKGVDAGSRLLIERIAATPDATCLDLGCGFGPIGLALARLCPQGMIHMVDRDFVAVDYARKNVEVNGLTNCRVYLSNGFSQVPPMRFDTIASNLPAKAGNEMLSLIMHGAHEHLRPGGSFYVVTIAGLKDYIKRTFAEVFGNYEKVKQGKTHLVSVARRQ